VAFAVKGGAGKRYAKLFDAGLRQMRESGALKTLLAAYSLTDWK
jgi:ABC-type amino acid transport substrate-binding protein